MRNCIFFVFLSLLLTYENNSDILGKIFESEGWNEVERISDSLTVYKKKLDKIDIPVFKATVVTDIDMDGILEAILDADGQEVFLEDS